MANSSRDAALPLAGAGGLDRDAASSPSRRGPLVDFGLLAVSIVWGSSYVVMQVIGQHLSVTELLAIRFLSAVLVLLAIYRASIKLITKEEIVVGLVFGVMLFSILALETLGVQHTSASNAGFIITLSVALVPIFERVIGKVRQGLPIYACTLASMAGCGLLTLSGTGELRMNTGDGIILAAAVIRGLQIFAFGHWTRGRHLSVLNVTLVELMLVCVLGILGSAAVGLPTLERLGGIPPHVWALCAYLGLFGTAYAFLVQLHAARLTSPTRVALILCTEPVFAALFAWGFAGNTLSLWQVGGGTVIVAAAVVGRVLEGGCDVRNG